MKKYYVIGLSIMLSLLTSSFAYTIDDVVVESWSGSGDNQALLVVDFWPGNGADDSFAFGAKFSTESITGLDLLNIVQTGNTDFTYSQTGGTLTDFWYSKNDTDYHVSYDWPDAWWSYWISDDLGQTWGFSMVGFALETVSDGDTNAWLAKPGSDWTSEPVVPVVPEPMTLTLLAFGSIVALRSKKKVSL